jgi:serine/threonine-protein kinase
VTLVLSRGPEIVKVPDVTRVPLAKAKRELKEAGLAPGVVTKAFSGDIPLGAVISTDPKAGTGRSPDSAVALVVSKGSPVDVPTVTGQSVEDATSTLEGLGLKVTVAPEQVNSPAPAGQVGRQSVPAGTRLGQGERVTLTVSKGPRMIPVPDVLGKEADEATRILKAAGFQVEVDRPLLSFSKVINKQSVEGGQQAPEGGTITITTKIL